MYALPEDTQEAQPVMVNAGVGGFYASIQVQLACCLFITSHYCRSACSTHPPTDEGQPIPLTARGTSMSHLNTHLLADMCPTFTLLPRTLHDLRGFHDIFSPPRCPL